MAEEFPKLLKIELIEHSAVEISDWVKDALEKARELVMSPSEDALSSTLIQSAFD